MPNETASLSDQGRKRKPRVRTGTGSHSPLSRVTVNLTIRAARALDQAAELTGDSKTDTINRALQVYAYLEQVVQAGGDILVRESADAEPQLIKMF